MVNCSYEVYLYSKNISYLFKDKLFHDKLYQNFWTLILKKNKILKLPYAGTECWKLGVAHDELRDY